MGLASHGRPDPYLDELFARVLLSDDPVEYRLDPRFIHYGPHTYSGRFTDHLPELLGRPPVRAASPSGNGTWTWRRPLSARLSALPAA